MRDDDRRFQAGLDLLHRSGAVGVQIRYSDDTPPTLWMAVGIWPESSIVGAAFGPMEALNDLLDRTVDGGKCSHCERPTVILHDFREPHIAPGVLCAYQYDPELAVFRRECEGEGD